MQGVLEMVSFVKGDFEKVWVVKVESSVRVWVVSSVRVWVVSSVRVWVVSSGKV